MQNFKDQSSFSDRDIGALSADGDIYVSIDAGFNHVGGPVSGGPGQGGGNKDKTGKSKNSSTTSTAGNIMKGGLVLGGSIAVGGGAGLDLPADAVAGVVIAGAAIAAGADLVWNLWLSHQTSNESYPGPWSYTYRPPSQDPINYRPGGMGNNDGPPEDYRNLWIKAVGVGVLGAKAYDAYRDYMDHLAENQPDKAKLPPSFSPTPAQNH